VTLLFVKETKPDPSVFTIMISSSPAAFLTKTILDPSGDQKGPVSEKAWSTVSTLR